MVLCVVFLVDVEIICLQSPLEGNLELVNLKYNITLTNLPKYHIIPLLLHKSDLVFLIYPRSP